MKDKWHVGILLLIVAAPYVWLALHSNLIARTFTSNELTVDCALPDRMSWCMPRIYRRIPVGDGVFVTRSEDFVAY